jgi:hypothetical protein
MTAPIVRAGPRTRESIADWDIDGGSLTERRISVYANSRTNLEVTLETRAAAP